MPRRGSRQPAYTMTTRLPGTRTCSEPSSHQNSEAERFAAAFAPKTRRGLLLRNLVIRACAIPGVARYTFGRDIVDALRLPDYRWPDAET
jgi:hypothetical protein